MVQPEEEAEFVLSQDGTVAITRVQQKFEWDWEPDGPGVYTISGLVPGLHPRGQVVALYHTLVIPVLARPERGRLCGVPHQRDVDLSELPLDARHQMFAARAVVAAMYRVRQRNVVSVLCWQHYGDC